jgi:DNA-binding IclR family transcriptional regulator
MNPGVAFYTRQIAKKLKMSLGTTHGSLQSLEKLNILAARGL